MIGGTSLGAMDSHPRRECKEPNGGLWDPLWWSETTTKVVVVGGLSVQQGTALPCSPLWMAVGPRDKITKLWGRWDLEGEVLGYKS